MCIFLLSHLSLECHYCTKSLPTDSESIICWTDILRSLSLICLYQSDLRNWIKLFGFLLLHTAVQAQGLQGVREGTNCQGYVPADDWCEARLFLSACQVAGMFNVLIIGCSVVYISLSAPLSHLNCQSTSKACRSSVFPLTPWMFSLSWVLVICYDLRASWQTGLL